MLFPATLLVILLAAIFALRAMRKSDEHARDAVWRRLKTRAGGLQGTFEPSLVAGLPPPAWRYFLYSIRPGTPIRTVAEIDMHGELGLGTRRDPNYQPMRARQILAPPYGFVWRVRAGRGVMRFSGSDGADTSSSWSRFWLLGTLPVARAGGGSDHRRAAFGRLIAEAVFWTPAALLPREGVAWTGIDAETARVAVEFDGLKQTVDVTVDGDGRPTSIVLPRWTDANPDRTFRPQPFGGDLYDFREVDGYRVATRVEAGNLYGTREYFPFFKAVVDELRFVDENDGANPSSE